MLFFKNLVFENFLDTGAPFWEGQLPAPTLSAGGRVALHFLTFKEMNMDFLDYNWQSRKLVDLPYTCVYALTKSHACIHPTYEHCQLTSELAMVECE
jgi:hypothetical protein